MRVLLGAAMAAWLAVPIPSVAEEATAVVIAEVYGGGGNAGAPFTHDFVELFNPGSRPVELGGWSVQYASATSGTWRTTELAGTIPAGGSYLVQHASAGSHGDGLPVPDAVGSIGMAAANGKVALAADREPLTCAASCAMDPSVVDLVGYGSANDFEGSGPAPAGGNALALVRLPCADTDDNAADFSADAPSPRSSAGVPAPCAPPDEEPDPCADDTDPALEVSARPSLLWPPNHRMTTIAITAVTDDDALVRLLEATSSEPDRATHDDPPGDVALGPDVVRLRAQRLGGGPGRTYTLVFEAVDACGNTAQASVLVRVPHDRRARG